MKITLQDLLPLSYQELSDLNRMVVGEIRRKRSIESLEKSSMISVGDIVTSLSDNHKSQYSIEKINRTKIIGKHLQTQHLWSMSISSLKIVKKHGE